MPPESSDDLSQEGASERKRASEGMCAAAQMPSEGSHALYQDRASDGLRASHSAPPLSPEGASSDMRASDDSGCRDPQPSPEPAVFGPPPARPAMRGG